LSSLSLTGRRILVTRAAHQASKLSEGLRELGATPVEVPVLEIQPPESFTLLDAAIRQLHSYDWLIFTSANTVRALAARAEALEIPVQQPFSLKVAAVGEATANAAMQKGFLVAHVPETYVAESLLEELKGQVSGKRILLARAAIARDLIPEALLAAGAVVDVVDAYRNVLPEAAVAQLQQAITAGIDAATFTSSSSVTHLEEAARRAAIPFPFTDVRAISIGPITSQTLRNAGWEPAAEANPSDIPGLIAALTALMKSNG
jgi:uroporphyrinogen-III synthase/uroporphyrinogen III methyltransferase/synthase